MIGKLLFYNTSAARSRFLYESLKTQACKSVILHQLLVMANVVPTLPILVTLMMEAIRSSETLLLTRDTRHNLPEDGILHSHHRECFSSYKNML
jgi:hypothetical protein